MGLTVIASIVSNLTADGLANTEASGNYLVRTTIAN